MLKNSHLQVFFNLKAKPRLVCFIGLVLTDQNTLHQRRSGNFAQILKLQPSVLLIGRQRGG